MGRRPPRPPSDRLRWRALSRLEEHLDTPMAVLGVIWLALFVIEIVKGSNGVLTFLTTVIWIVFVAEFVLRLVIAPDRWLFIRKSWLTIIALLVPALRVLRFLRILRVLRATRAVRGVRLVRTVGALNRGMGALGATLRRSGVWYVAGLTIVVSLAGAAGMYALEPHAAGGAGFTSYSDALWWTVMIMTTMGSGYWPQTGEGRILAFVISLFSIGVFGYVTATLASFLVGRDAAAADGSTASGGDVRALQRDIAAMRRELREMSAASSGSLTAARNSVPPQ
jgi:voltage-gated potassium channel